MASEVPEPVYFHEQVNGIVWRRDNVLGVSLVPLSPPVDADVVVQGEIVLRYGIDLLKSPHQMVPGYFETENGVVKTGRAAWDFMRAKFQLYPRGDVKGIRNDGRFLHVLMRDLDFFEPPLVLAYQDTNAEQAIGVLARVDVPPDAELPKLLAQYTPSLQ